MTVGLRAATDADLTEIVSLLKANALPVAGIANHLETAVIASEDGIVGCAAVEVYGAVGLLRSVAVAAERRGEGWGQRLTAAAIDLARRRGVDTLYLLTTTADRFFPKFGFTTIDRRELDPALAASEELRGACPDTAVAMRRRYGSSTRTG